MFEKSYDVAVCGGGVAGAAAAIAAARRGQKTALIEKTIFTGGLATTGIIFIYLPLCDGNGTQVTFGIPEELLLSSIKYGPGDVPEWQKGRKAEEAKRYRAVFSPASFVIALDELLTNAGVDIWFDTLVCAANVHDGRLAAVEVENKSGRGRISAKCFVDATGDADIAHQAGLGCPAAQNALAFWALEYANGAQWRLNNSVENIATYVKGSSWDKKRGTSGIDGSEVSSFILDGRTQYRERLVKEYGTGKKDRKTLFPLTLPSMAQFRTTRHIPALYKLKDGQDWTHFDDSIGLAADWRKPGFVWEIPYRSMLPAGLKNLVAAGRCTAAEEDAWEVTRVIPAAALTGEAAGTAAALAAASGVSPDDIPVATLQEALRRAGNKIHFDEVGLVGKK
ncbi:MAG: FAD-dependent oxidoreductase [Victivallaceae bacterium]|jgi:hypothetical protein